MKLCQYKPTDGGFECVVCRHRWCGTGTAPIRDCSVSMEMGVPMVVRAVEIVHQAPVKGPGDHLHDAILRWVGESPTNDCQCRSRIAQMNAWGPAGCREHLDEIVDWLIHEAAKRGWWKCVVAVPGSSFFIRRMVLGAIKKGECRDCGLSSAIPC